MITDFSVQNFRCFENTQAKGFQRVNLFTGKNNAGKTSFLEAIFAFLQNSLSRVIENTRKNTHHDEQKIENLFFNQDIDKSISFSTHFNKNYIGSEIDIRMLKASNHKLRDFREINLPLPENEIVTNQHFTNGTENFRDEHQEFLQINKNISFIFSSDEQYPEKINIPKIFDKLDIEGESGDILEVIKHIDQKIEEIKTYGSRPDVLYLRKVGEKKRFPLSYFGDAIQKIMRYVITMVNFKQIHFQNDFEVQNYLIIDEIENGLHYTVQEIFWEMLFKLAQKYNIQIFATTHSKEMVNAFEKIASKKKFKNEGAYFEMFREVPSDKIVVQKMHLDVLEYEIEQNGNFRGE